MWPVTSVPAWLLPGTPRCWLPGCISASCLMVTSTLSADQAVRPARQPCHTRVRDTGRPHSAPLQAQLHPVHCQQHPSAGVCPGRPAAVAGSVNAVTAGWRGGGAPGGSVAGRPFVPAEAAASLACGLCASQSHGVLRWRQRAGIALTSRGSRSSRAWRWRAGWGTLA